MGLLTHALSTITSPAFSEVTVFYREYDLGVVLSSWFRCLPSVRWLSPFEMKEEALSHRWRFDGLRMMHRVRAFRLALCVDVWDAVGEYSVRMLQEAVTAERAGKGFNDSFPEPMVFYNPRRSRQIPGSLSWGES